MSSPPPTGAAAESVPENPTPNGAADRSAIVRLVHVRKSFGRQAVLRDISLEIQRGLTTVVLGPSGCGKSVLLKHIIGLLRPDSGQVWYEDVRVDTLSEVRLGAIRMHFGVLFQQGALFDSMSVRQNVGFSLVEHTDLNAAERERRIRRVLRMVGMVDSIDKMPSELSGGQRKRVALARAIILEPKVILYDEPTTGLDPIRSDVINELIIKLQSELGITSVVVTHDLSSAFKVADWMVMLYDGQLALEGTPQVFRDTDHPQVRRFLLGEASEEELKGIHARGGGGRVTETAATAASDADANRSRWRRP